ncbi:hypothetical protein FQV27_15680 [Paracoccus aurantiacus]|uniref:RiboL-PSP-HEPN domain-containing protein n=1 Tax=Paracoccus aurantiacus TaxID=2599412 RepID=A0A5C6RZ25_9RHOB|nr:HEPN domain-containing protein [Paracoccus aurantiacus]TXB67531.1 hypothetical protein FQV27_15680 [Paracoccus aurantiacus]
MSEFDDLYDELSVELTNIEQRFLERYFPVDPSHTPDVFEYDVKSYCILSHASFEEFLEMMAEKILSKVESEFLSRQISLATASLLLSYATNWSQGGESNAFDTCFDAVRKAISDCKSKHSATLKDNHGFALKYMLKVLNPVGINPPNDSLKLDSASKLAKARGSFAHRKSKNAMYGEYRSTTRPLAPEDARKIVADCLQICSGVRDSANSRW